MTYLQKENCVRICDGDPSKILLALLNTGLGTSVHALPAISEMVKSGLNVTVNCKEFQRPIYESVGANLMTIAEPFGIGWFLEHKADYGKIVSLATWDQWQQWKSGENTTGTMAAFADILDVELPDEFSWVETLNAGESESNEEYILFAPNSTERWRSLPEQVADDVERELQQFGNVIRLYECGTWEQLRDLIYGASHVVTVESGISNVAGALNKKMLCLIGMTEIETTVEQYRKYIPDLEYRVVKGFQPIGCSMPCMRMKERGFFNDRCLGVHNLPECLSHLNVQEVSEQFSLLLEG